MSLTQVIMSFFGTVGFSIIFNVPKRELIFCGIIGCLGWILYLILEANNGYILATLCAAAIVTALSRCMSVIRKNPVTLYLIPGIIPLVPGAGIYFTMFHIVMGEYMYAALQGIETLARAGTISLGLLIILSLPLKLFTIYTK